ncbi:MAG: PucC family protein [Nitratireductor sp.]
MNPSAVCFFGLTPGETTKISGVQHGGVLLGMAVVGIMGSLLASRKPQILRFFTVWGCMVSALALAGLALGATMAPQWPLKANIFALGAANGAFAVAAIGSMMVLAGAGGGRREGIRMGVWGAAQAISFGLGGFMGTVAIDITRKLTHSDANAFFAVFSSRPCCLSLPPFWQREFVPRRARKTANNSAAPS